MQNLLLVGAVACATLGFAHAQNASCNAWSRAYSNPLPGVTGDVLSQVVFDDGSGPALYVGGTFAYAGDVLVNGIARWDGSQWSALGVGLTHPSDLRVETLFVWDDGSGPALYAGGRFHSAGGVPARNVARWSGTSWSALGALRGSGDTVAALAAFDVDGPGPLPERLVAGGSFTLGGFDPGALPISKLGVWDGVQWTELAGGVVQGEPSFVDALCVHDDGSGLALYVGGRFQSAGGLVSPGLARWDGSSWSQVGTLAEPPNQESVRDLLVWDDGSGAALYATGEFDRADAQIVNGVARWDGQGWSALGGGIPSYGGGVQQGVTLAAFDDGTGERLFLGGVRPIAFGFLNYLTAWDGTGWSGVGAASRRPVRSLAVFDDGSGAGLFVGGEFTSLGGQAVSRIARLSASGVETVGPAGVGLLSFGSDTGIWSLAVYDAGDGPELYAAGRFLLPDGVTSGFGRWDGSSWSCLDDGTGCTDELLLNDTLTLEVFDDGAGAALYAGGTFDLPGGVSDVARWDGTSWSEVGGGIVGAFVTTVRGLSFGGSADLYVGGNFISAGGVAAKNIARWDGSAWSALADGLRKPPYDLIVFDDGSGPALFAAGAGFTPGPAPEQGIGRWDGTSWTFPGANISGIFRSFEVFDADDGQGPQLYVGGAAGVWRWNGVGWSIAGSLIGGVRDLFVFDDGAGPQLYAAGEFAGGLARFDGLSWETLSQGLTNSIGDPVARALAAYAPAGAGPEQLFVGGAFETIDQLSSMWIAEWLPTGASGCPNGTGVPFCDGAAPGAPCPCGNTGGIGRGCAHSQNLNGARLVGSGDPATNSVVMRVDGLPLATPTAVLFRSLAPSTPAEGVPFGDGLLCVGVPVTRISALFAGNGMVQFPLNHAAGPGAFYYQVTFRNFAPQFCTPDGFNLTNGFQVSFP